jgi:hypothetical protein
VASDKRRLHYIEKRLRRFPSYILLVAAVLSLGIAAFALRQNNLEMIRLRNEVFKVDEAGGDVEAALRDLREHVHAHMNSDVASGDNVIRPPIQLKYTYERLVAEEQQRVREANQSIYAEAERICEDRFPAGRLVDGRVQCVEQYVSERGVSQQPVPKELYQFDFVSPRWSPDLAGWALVAAVGFGVMYIGRVVVGALLRYRLLKSHHLH